jgi:hypothetical protein
VKKLWKLHFAKQINTSELQLLINFRRSHLNPQDVGRISTLTTGVFDIAIFTRLLTKLGASLEYYEPDAMVKSYLFQHSHSLGWDKDKLNFRNPKEKDSRHKGDSRSTKRKSPNSKIEGRDNKSKRLKVNPQKVSPRDQCKRKPCRDKGTHVNHAHKDCRYKSNDRPQKSASDVKRHDGPRHPNLGQAPPKKGRNAKSAVPSTSNTTKPETRTCYICNKPGHIAPNCPDKAANKQKAQDKLFKNKNFMVLWQESWDDQDEQTCASRVIQAWGEDNLCPHCHQAFTFDHRCDTEDRRINQKFDKVKAKLRQSPLLKMIREAHEHQEYQSSSTENETPFTMDHSFFLGEDEGQQDDDDEHHQAQSSDEQEDVESRSPTPPSDDPLESQSETESGSEARSDYSDTDAPY